MPGEDTQQALLEGAPTIGNGRYRLVAKLGEGGMAAVYRAWDTKLQRWRAIKVLLPEFARRKKLRQRFENEATLMARIDHRHVVAVNDVGTDEALPYIVMELADGGSLIDWCEVYGAMPPRLAVDVAMQICKGVGAAHELGVVHRDIKPHNVLITGRGLCKVTDFGIAQIQDAGGMTKTGSVMGTLGYMAPEQRTDSKHVDVRADVYSIGATIYKLLTNRSVADLFLAEHDATLLDGVPDVLAPVLLRATAYRPDDRYDDVAQLARALFDARAQLPPNPDDTPALAIPPEHLSPGALPDVSEPTFPEIEELLAGHQARPPQAAPTQALQPPADVRPAGAQPAAPPDAKVLPYFMPVREARPGRSPDDPPSYIDPEELGRPSSLAPLDLGIDDETRKKAEAARQRAIDEGRVEGDEPDHHAPERDDEGDGLDAAATIAEFFTSVLEAALNGIKKPIAALALPLSGLTLIACLAVGSSAWSVRTAATAAHETRDALYAELTEERLIVDDLVALGANRVALEGVYAEFEKQRKEPARMDAAIRVISILEHESRLVAGRAGSGLGHKAEMVQQRMARLQERVGAYEAAMLAWEQAADSERGRLAVQLGVADRP